MMRMFVDLVEDKHGYEDNCSVPLGMRADDVYGLFQLE